MGKEIYKTIVENQYNIGIVGLSPMVQGVIVTNNDLKNVPDAAGNDWAASHAQHGLPGAVVLRPVATTKTNTNTDRQDG